MKVKCKVVSYRDVEIEIGDNFLPLTFTEYDAYSSALIEECAKEVSQKMGIPFENELNYGEELGEAIASVYSLNGEIMLQC